MFPPGARISHFEILEKLGAGGMGTVYKARDQRLDRLVAIKVLSPDAVSKHDRQLRFVHEAKSASALNHPNIITVYEIDASGETAFIAMEYVEGRTLDRIVPQKGLRLAETLHYAVQIADALAAAHGAGIIHRDVKPANIMVTGNGRVKVLDFGLAKLSERGLSSTHAAAPAESQPTVSIEALQSEEGTIVGTIAYMSPEQAEAKKIDARSDIFSFGAVLYEMLTGRRAFAGDTRLSTLAAILNQDPRSAAEMVPSLPREVERVLARCLRKDPARRFQTMADLKVALEELKEDTESGRLTQSAVPAQTRSKLHPALLGAAIVVLLAAVSLSWRALRPASKPEAPVKLTPLTTYPGSERFPSFSPDGSQVAFSWNGEKQENDDIWVKMVDGGVPLRLTNSSQPARAPAWSPDGRYIAFSRTDGVYLISPLGGPERKLCDLPRMQSTYPGAPTARNFSWNPDSKSLALASRAAATGPARIFLVAIDTGEMRPLTEPPEQSMGDVQPVFSTDGRTLAFVRYGVSGTGDIFLVSAAGGKVTRVTSDHRSYYGLAWTPDGRDLVFSSTRSGTPAMWRLSANAPEGAEPRLVPGVTGDPAELAISRAGPDGLFKMIYASFTFDIDIWQCDLPRADHPTRLIASTRSEQSGRYSPDGKRIAFASDRSGYSEIWLCDSDGSNAVALTSFATFAGSPRWSPDGLRIAFDGIHAGNRDIYVIGARGGAARRLTTEPSEESRPSFSNDGRWIYFMSDRSGSRQVWKMPSDGGTAVQLTRQGGLEPSESPDSRLVYYIKERTRPGLRSVPVDGGEEVTVIESAALNNWAVTSKGIYFFDVALRSPAGIVPLKFYSFQARTTAETARLEYENSGGPSIGVDPEGHRALYTRSNRRDSDLFLLENLR